MQTITIDTKYKSHLTVTEEATASAAGSGNLPVLATPAMIALMENAAMNAIAPHLDKGESSVGITIAVNHTRATALGQQVSALARVLAVEGRRVEFEITAWDDEGLVIGTGTHARMVIDTEKFMAKIKK